MAKRIQGDTVHSVRPTPTAAATDAVGATKMVRGCTYAGIITGRDESGFYDIKTVDPEGEVSGAVLATAVLGGLSGFNVKCHLTQGTRVEFAYGNTPVIYAVIPPNVQDWYNAGTRSLLWGDAAASALGILSDEAMDDYTEDLLEGEAEISNLYGISLQMLTTLLRVTAGDRAAVECHLINDMVRIISAQFHHVSGMGEEMSFDHGRPTLERNWSSYRHEVFGNLNERDDIVALEDGSPNREAIASERVSTIGRHRLHELIGFAGDFIHSFISDPAENLTKLVQEDGDTEPAAGSGKSWFHRNSDGSLIAQSVADIRLERVCRIPVPIRRKHHEDQSITSARDYESLGETLEAQLPELDPSDRKHTFRLAYHIRTYSRWLTRFHSYMRLLQLPDEYNVPRESDAPEPSWNNQEKDREDLNPEVAYYDAYACITIMRDGSIVNHDGYGSSIVMSNGNIQVSSSRHLDLEAAADIRVVAGGSFYVRARRNIELSATVGGLILHGYTWLRAMCERGSVWLRSNAKTSEAPARHPDDTTAPLPEIAGRDGSYDGAAVLIEATEGKSISRASHGMDLIVDGAPADDNDTSRNLNLHTRGDVDINSSRNVILRASKNLWVRGLSSFVVSATRVRLSTSKFSVGNGGARPEFAVNNNKVHISRAYVDNLKGKSIEGPEVGSYVPQPDPDPNTTVKRHLNHIQLLREDFSPFELEQDEKDIISDAGDAVNGAQSTWWTSTTSGPLWAFSDGSEYVWDVLDGAGGMPETLTQQYLRVDGGVGIVWRDDVIYEDWTLGGSLEGLRVGSGVGFGSFMKRFEAYSSDDATDNLHQPTTSDPSDLGNLKVAWDASSDFTIKVLKRPE